jgi:putative transcription factor
MACNICGTGQMTWTCTIEGITMNVCDSCVKYGTRPQKIVQEQPIKKASSPMKTQETTTVQVIVPDYAKRIQHAREQRGLKQADFAKLIAEKESVIHSLESGRMKPNLDLARKLERALRITLVEQIEDSTTTARQKTSEDTLTFGDLLR